MPLYLLVKYSVLNACLAKERCNGHMPASCAIRMCDCRCAGWKSSMQHIGHTGNEYCLRVRACRRWYCHTKLLLVETRIRGYTSSRFLSFLRFLACLRKAQKALLYNKTLAPITIVLIPIVYNFMLQTLQSKQACPTLVSCAFTAPRVRTDFNVPGKSLAAQPSTTVVGN